MKTGRRVYSKEIGECAEHIRRFFGQGFFHKAGQPAVEIKYSTNSGFTKGASSIRESGSMTASIREEKPCHIEGTVLF
jgi:hypothetical protein